MAKFNEVATQPKVAPTQTHEGGGAVRPTNPLTELEFTAAVTFVGEDTFYERADQRLARLVSLTHDATKRNPHGVAQLVADLRSKYLIRGAAIVVAAEYVKAYEGRGPLPRFVVSAACQRADEPAEFVAYWHKFHGKSLPSGVRKGLGDALSRLLNQKSALKWNSHERAIRLADVIELAHPVPGNEDQGALFTALLDERHWGSWDNKPNDGREQVRPSALDKLPVISQHLKLARLPEDERRPFLRANGPKALADAGFTWERLSAWLPGGMDAEAWEAVIPNMGVMALIRNLRNFDQAGISEDAITTVINKITSEDDVRGAKVLPFRAYQAYKQAPSDNWKLALGKTLNHASGNIARMDGSLLLVDASASMGSHLSAKSDMTVFEAALLQALSVARNSDRCDVVLFGTNSGKLSLDMRGASILGTMQKVIAEWPNMRLGSSTFGHTALAKHWDASKHTRAVIFTDDQMHDSMELGRDEDQYGWYRRNVTQVSVKHVPEIITFRVGGYQPQTTWGKGRIHVAGLSDQIFNAVANFVR